MRNHPFLLFFVSLILGTAGLAQNPPLPADTSRVLTQDATAVQDSLAQDWTTRSPLTEKELQRRTDNRAEVEDMKKRFRRFHQEETTQQTEEHAEAEDDNYLWSDAESGGQTIISRKGTPERTVSEDPEELRMEISRNLQQGRNPDAVVPAGPVLPIYNPDEESPQIYDAPTMGKRPSPIELENSIQYSLNATANNEADWQAKVGIAKVPLMNPANGTPLQAGQVIILEEISFLPNDSQLQPSNYKILDQWVLLLKTYPDLLVEVRSHSFGISDAIVAQQITRERSQNITDYWLQQGAGIQQLSFRGYGNLSPLVPSGAPHAQQKNERIELIILELPDR
jgi:outer membrane protein OmpA-like peptidoglycan-associated protein